jgi:hypothetical protein
MPRPGTPDKSLFEVDLELVQVNITAQKLFRRAQETSVLGQPPKKTV